MPEGKLAEAFLQTALAVLREQTAGPEGTSAAEFSAQLHAARQALDKAALRILPEVVTDPEELAKVLKSYSEPQRRELLEHLAEIAPERVEALRPTILLFADLLSCKSTLIQKILHQVDWKEVGLALKTASEDLQARFFANMSERAAAMVREEMEFMGPVRLVDVEAAQTKISDLAASLLREELPSEQEPVAAGTEQASEFSQQILWDHSGPISLRERLLRVLADKTTKEYIQEDIDRLLREALGEEDTTDGTAGH